MRFTYVILLIMVFIFQSSAFAQKSKNRKAKTEVRGPRIFEVVGDSVRTDSVVYYETEIGFVAPDLSTRFIGRWSIDVMRRQAKAIPDTFSHAYIEFYGDTLFNAYVGCNKLHGKYIIKGPTIKFSILATDSSLTGCANTEIESWFISLMEKRVSYFGIDEKMLYLKDVAYNIVFDCSRRKEEQANAAVLSQNN